MPCICVLSSCLVHSWESGQNRTQQQQRAKPGKEAFLPSFAIIYDTCEVAEIACCRKIWQSRRLHFQKGAPKHRNARKVRSPSENRFGRRFGACGSHLAKDDAVESRKIQFRESLKMEKMEMQCHWRLQNKFNPLMVIEISFVNLPRNPNFDTMSWSFRPHFIPSWRRLCSRLQRDSIE